MSWTGPLRLPKSMTACLHECARRAAVWAAQAVYVDVDSQHSEGLVIDRGTSYDKLGFWHHLSLRLC